MKRTLLMASLSIAFAGHLSAQSAPAEHSPELAKRADSLARLDPAKELRRAIAKRDLRFIAVCGYACQPSGVSPQDPFFPKEPDLLRRIEGTTDEVTNRDVARLDSIAYLYAVRYNKLLVEHLRRTSRSRPAS